MKRERVLGAERRAREERRARAVERRRLQAARRVAHKMGGKFVGERPALGLRRGAKHGEFVGDGKFVGERGAKHLRAPAHPAPSAVGDEKRTKHGREEVTGETAAREAREKQREHESKQHLSKAAGPGATAHEQSNPGGRVAAALRLKMRKMAAALRHERLVAARAQAALRSVEAGEAKRTAAKEIAKVEAAGQKHEAAARQQAAQVKNI